MGSVPVGLDGVDSRAMSLASILGGEFYGIDESELRKFHSF